MALLLETLLTYSAMSFTSPKCPRVSFTSPKCLKIQTNELNKIVSISKKLETLIYCVKVVTTCKHSYCCKCMFIIGSSRSPYFVLLTVDIFETDHSRKGCWNVVYIWFVSLFGEKSKECWFNRWIIKNHLKNQKIN